MASTPTSKSPGGPQNNLGQVFPRGEIFAVSDDEWLLLAATYYGLTPIPLDENDRLPEDANVVLFLRHNLVSRDIRKMFRRHRVLLVPIASFDPGLEVALYTQKLVLSTDYVAACRRTRYWIESLKNQPGMLRFTGEPAAPESAEFGELPATRLTCGLAEQLSADAWPRLTIGPGQWVGVGSYCEISITTRPSDELPSFTLAGTAVASGLLVARDPRFTTEGDARIQAAERLREKISGHGPIVLRLEGGILTDASAGGRDFTKEIDEVTNPAHGLRALELGIGTNHDVLARVNWKINSQLNEGVGPVHIGFGEGMTGAHMDFIVAAGTHEFMAPAA